MMLKEVLNLNKEQLKEYILQRWKILKLFEFEILEVRKSYVRIKVKHKDFMEGGRKNFIWWCN